MKSHELFFVILLSIGAIQGFIYAIILWRTHSQNRIANKFLASILFFFTYRLVVEILKLFGVGYSDDIFYHLLLEYNWIYGALIYFFVKAYVSPNFKFNWRQDWVHFLPVIIEFAWSNFIKSQNFYWDGTRESLTWLGYWGYVVWMQWPTQYVISAALIIIYISKAENLLKLQHFDSYDILPEKTKWIRRVLTVMKWYSVLVILVVLIDFIGFDYAFNRSYHYFIFVGMALITYWLGLEGYNRKNETPIKLKTILDPKEREQLQHISDQLKVLMEKDQVFKEPDLSLSKLSKELGVKSYLVTKCLGIIHETKFNDFVNAYRIEEVKRLLSDPKNDQFTLLSLAFDAGFNSKASFNRAVKKLTGKSPSALKH
ncbi:AraC family transcriptional regulator [Psychroserpens sp.]|uniref:helix-turn-helix domain-containing protein n=1 Tax=Psychroserpens sp. TaxID=2020870 RepID=UPI001B10FF9A|nr:AraC family transcriptional regulator [Psychroserpens sp.]MBO6605780.1 helix-turn-helix transcriptional regulator [Psychroserpens sp.]MBO6631456.1 helix-turn-helix transcriptional regulator [Psychroserpens sp.]MBO6652849.1 helix-turn-helix transcriptional regulator [Psychroserpens sp.]MBO6681379.1 helix-turn-helix transcriptional regulator [Psychroserpens sp.]MBO6749154.1 helix-turn-helix transcriptional regulator [Psychroserpens sp.]